MDIAKHMEKKMINLVELNRQRRLVELKQKHIQILEELKEDIETVCTTAIKKINQGRR